MEQQNYHCSIAAGISPEQAYASIANVRGWWAKNFSGQAHHVGDKFAVRFGDTTVDFKIVEADPGKKVVWQVTDCHLPWLNDKKEWNNTRVVWTISPVDGATQINMTHEGLQPAVECYETCRKGWDEHIKDSLFKLVTEGAGQPT